MSVTVDSYTTSKFILKDDAAVEYIKKIVSTIAEGNSLQTGYLAKDAYIRLIEYGERSFKFIGDGFMDSCPEIHSSALQEDYDDTDLDEDDEDYSYQDPISLFDEIQKNLEIGSWFFVENHSVEKSYYSSYVALYHQDGTVDYRHSHDLKREMLRSKGIDGGLD